ncbi:MAG: hypothetical protein HW416_3601 [Chloroflexi bacterium]|nr:hypothetical protein [Chloroflexota bacterium]
MLIDQWLPTYDMREHHDVLIRATPEEVDSALRRTDLARSPLIRGLFAVRNLPSLRLGLTPARRRLTLDEFQATGFVLLADQPAVEMVLGVIGRFWTVRGELLPIGAAEFAAFGQPGYAKAALNFAIFPLAGDRTRLATETRVHCLDAASRRQFRGYWTLIGPFSGFVRREWLRLVRDTAEHS